MVTSTTLKADAEELGSPLSSSCALFLMACQAFFAVSILGKAAALLWHFQAFAKPDFLFGVPQTLVMKAACLFELLLIILLGSKNIRSGFKLQVLLATSSAFITYHVWALITGKPTCPCLGNLFAQTTAAKISFGSAIVLFAVSAYLLLGQPAHGAPHAAASPAPQDKTPA